MWIGVWLILTGLLGAYVAYLLYAREAQDRITAQGISLQARLRYQQTSQSPWTVVESITCGWLNLLLKYMWPGFISNIATNLTVNQLNNLFARLSRMLSGMPIFRVVFSQMVLRELCMGATPPRFANATVRIHPEEAAMEVEVDIDWATSGMRLVVDSLVSLSEQQWNMKLTGFDVILRGRMLFVLKLSRSRLPGIVGMHFSFVQKPYLTFDIALKGVMFSELPGLVSELKRRLVNIIAAEAVEPARVWIDLAVPFSNLVTRKQGGRLGHLKVTLLRGTDLKPARLKASPVESRETEQCMCFVEMLALGRSYVGPIAPQGNSPEWDWTFFLPVDCQPTAAGAVVARFTVHNFMSRKQPQIVGEGSLSVDDFTMEQLTQKEPHVVKVRIKSARGYEGGGGVLYIGLSHDATTGRNGSASVGAVATTQPINGAANVVAGSHASAPAAGVPLGAFVPNGQRNSAQGSSGTTGLRTGSAAGASAVLPPLQEVPEEEWVSAAGSARGGGGSVVRMSTGPDDNLPFNMARELEKGLAAAAPDASLNAAQRRIEALEQALELETKRRHEEELRALLEGAPFVLHRGSDRTLRHVWVADVPEKAGAMLRWQSNKGMTWSRARGARANLAKLPYHEAAVSLLTSVTYGKDLFPEVQLQQHMAKTKAAMLHKDQCLSLLLNVQGDQDEITVALHLQVPEGGNGRSRNEWVSAFNSLMCRKLPIYQPEESES
eukprot:jgi/Ulvmu1/10142/UM006_0096.1